MGREVLALLARGFAGCELAAAVDPFAGEEFLSSLHEYTGDADVIVDFSNRAATGILTEYATRRSIPLVLATTGQSEEELAMVWRAATQIPVFFSANMSLGIAALLTAARAIASVYPDADIEIIEKHHNRKLDAPSGTALMLARAIGEVREETTLLYGRGGQKKREPNEIGIHAVRMGNIVGEHEVMIGTDSETITLRHEAHNRALFAEGALRAAAFLKGRPAGMYSMNDLVAK